MKKILNISAIITLLLSACNPSIQVSHILYEELTPTELRQRISEAPIAFLPLGTIEWHGEHLPLGSDGMQSREFFKELATETGGIVFPMLFLGPDGKQELEDGSELYGMDRGNFIKDTEQAYEPQKFEGSCYWVDDDFFFMMIDAAMKQIARAGFKIVVAHGHGPSTAHVQDSAHVWKVKYGLQIISCWGDQAGDGMGIMVDHAAMNESSLMMAFYPELVHMEYLSEESWPEGVGGKDPRIYASRELGLQIIETQKQRMIKVIKEELGRLGDEVRVIGYEVKSDK